MTSGMTVGELRRALDRAIVEGCTEDSPVYLDGAGPHGESVRLGPKTEVACFESQYGTRGRLGRRRDYYWNRDKSLFLFPTTP